MATVKLTVKEVWQRDPESDIECPICKFERGSGEAFAYLCQKHPRTQLIGTRVYRCPRHQQEVSPLMLLGSESLAEALQTVKVSLFRAPLWD